MGTYPMQRTWQAPVKIFQFSNSNSTNFYNVFSIFRHLWLYSIIYSYSQSCNSESASQQGNSGSPMSSTYQEHFQAASAQKKEKLLPRFSSCLRLLKYWDRLYSELWEPQHWRSLRAAQPKSCQKWLSSIWLCLRPGRDWVTSGRPWNPPWLGNHCPVEQEKKWQMKSILSHGWDQKPKSSPAQLLGLG